MFHRISAVLSSARTRRDRDAGFTMVEVLGAAAITAVLAAAVMVVVTGSLRFLSSSGLVTGAQAKAQYVLSEFSSVAREGQLVTATETDLVFITRGEGRCDRHTYALEADASDASLRQLSHTISSTTVPYGMSCQTIVTFPVNASNTVTRVEMDGLAATSKLNYYDKVGQAMTSQTLTSLGSGALCAIGGIELSLDLNIITQNKTVTSTETGFAAIRNNARGLGC